MYSKLNAYFGHLTHSTHSCLIKRGVRGTRFLAKTQEFPMLQATGVYKEVGRERLREEGPPSPAPKPPEELLFFN